MPATAQSDCACSLNKNHTIDTSCGSGEFVTYEIHSYTWPSMYGIEYNLQIVTDGRTYCGTVFQQYDGQWAISPTPWITKYVTPPLSAADRLTALRWLWDCAEEAQRRAFEDLLKGPHVE